MGPANSAVERSEDDVMQLDGKARKSAMGISVFVGWLVEFSVREGGGGPKVTGEIFLYMGYYLTTPP